MKITIEIPDAEFHAMVSKQVAEAIGGVMLRHQSQNLAAIRAEIQELSPRALPTLVTGSIYGPIAKATPLPEYVQSTDFISNDSKIK